MREFELLSRVYALNQTLPASVMLPPGDDMAALTLPRHAASLLVAADSAVEGTHTPLGGDAYDLGRKAVLRNLSDVAAMGNAQPLAILACAMIPEGTEDARIWRLFEGVRETGLAWGAPLIGGDTTVVGARSALSVAVTILATPIDQQTPLATRSSARIGDGVYVTGVVGGAWDPQTGLGRHLHFPPRLAVAHALSQSLGVRLHAMIDVSDGLAQDLGHVAKSSAVDIELVLSQVPLANGVVVEDAIRHGEDYELAFTASGAVPLMLEGVAITRIGTVCGSGGEVRIVDVCGARDLPVTGWEHGS